MSITESGIVVPDGADGPSRVGRRTMIKRAAAAGAVAWSAPVVLASKASASAAGTLAAECYRFQFNWWYRDQADAHDTPDDGSAGNLSHNLMLKLNNINAPAGTWNEECQKSDDDTVHLAGWDAAGEYNSNQSSVNGQCCKDSSDPISQPYDWWQADSSGGERIKTFPTPECVQVSPACGAGTGDGFQNQTIRFSFNSSCSDCYFLDPHLTYTDDPVNLGSQSKDNMGGRWHPTVDIVVGATRIYPVYFKAWIVCGPSNSTFVSAVLENCNGDPIEFET